MESPTPHLALTHEGPIDPRFLKEFRDAVAAAGLELRIEPGISTRAMASLEWIMPTAIMVWVFKAYFDGFLKELGKAHALALAGAVKHLGKRLAGLRYARVTAQGPVSWESRFSPIYSIWTERDARSRFKMLIPNGLTEVELDAALTAYLVFAEAYHTGTLDPEALAILADARPLGGVVLLAYDEASAKIHLIDPLAERSR